jgi:dihydroorotate dehydrogenase (NAD+) catalytic subunit
VDQEATLLQVECGPLKLANPIMTASGTFGYGPEMSEFFDLKVPGAVVVKTVTLNPRAGNPAPRMVEVPGGILNSIGLPNGGAEHFARNILPAVRGKAACLIVNIAGETWEQFGEVAARLAAEPGIDAFVPSPASMPSS